MKISDLILYEIYPRSFQDSTGNGYGDLKGIITRLDYLKDLGINALWLTPFFPSPMKDVGYDVSDYCDVAEEFGTLQDFKDLIAEAHKREIQLVIDLVVNHTSDQHPWFIESRSSRTNPKRDWYIWKDPVNGSVPNNWKSVFEPTPWKFDETTGQYYFHAFLTEQPDLNWANPEVHQAVKDIMKFWIDMGVDGFRLDAANYYCKDQRYLDEPKNPDFVPGVSQPYQELKHIYMRDQESLFPILDELGKFAEEHGKFLIPESSVNGQGLKAIPTYKKYYEKITSGNVIPFNFEYIRMPWDAEEIRSFTTAYLHALKENEVPNFVLGNHDRPRLASRIGHAQAKVAAVLLLTLPGIPVIYYGEELGMEDVKIPRNMIHDTKEFTSPGFGRDPERTPMQWDGSEKAGFTTGDAWLPFEEDYKIRNVASESQDPSSMLSLYKSLLKLRHKNPVLQKGKYEEISIQNKNVFAFQRVGENTANIILCNFSADSQKIILPFQVTNLVLTTVSGKQFVSGAEYILEANEACILERDSFNSR